MVCGADEDVGLALDAVEGCGCAGEVLVVVACGGCAACGAEDVGAGC